MSERDPICTRCGMPKSLHEFTIEEFGFARRCPKRLIVTPDEARNATILAKVGAAMSAGGQNHGDV